MFCDNCKERDAIVTLTRAEDSGVTEVHLCEKCAAERGIETPLSTAAKNPLVSFLAMQKQMPLVQADSARCAFCSSTLRDFRANGRLGCARCYGTFEGSIRDLLRRVHGNSRHVGKRYLPPERSTGEPPTVLVDLQERLRRAIESEQFELAAKLRDQIKVLE